MAFGTSLTACLTLLVLPVKHIYEIQRLSSSNAQLMTNTDNDIRPLIDRSDNRNSVIENERDKLLIQPIVRNKCFSNNF